MIHRSVAAATVSLLLAIGSTDLHAQNPLGFELRGGLASPSGELDESPLERGVGFEGSVSYRFQPRLSAYFGWDWWRFEADEGFAGAGVDLEETGFAFGLRYDQPFSGRRESGPGFWIRGGGTADHFELEDADGRIIADSGYGPGWEVGAGLSLPWAGWRLTPGVRVRYLSRDVEVESRRFNLGLRTFAFEFGVAHAF